MSTDCPTTNSDTVESLFPDGASPEIAFEQASDICLELKPSRVGQIIVQVCRDLFSDIRNIRDPDVRKLLERGGRQTNTSGPIHIATADKWDPMAAGASPAIVVVDGKWTRRSELISDAVSGNVVTGEESRVVQYSGSHLIHTSSTACKEAQDIGFEVARFFTEVRDELVAEFSFTRLILDSFGPSATMKEPENRFVYPVSISYVVSHHWSVQSEMPGLKRIRFMTNPY